MTEDEMVGWHHRLDGHESEYALLVGDGQGGLACCRPWGCKELDMTERLNWIELNCRLAVCCIKMITLSETLGKGACLLVTDSESCAMSAQQRHSKLHFSFLPFWEVGFSAVFFLFLLHSSCWSGFTFHALSVLVYH